MTKRVVLAMAATAMATTFLAVASSPAGALSCAPTSAADAIADSPVVFLGEQVAESADTIEQTFRVDRWIRGGDEAEVEGLRSRDWGSSFMGAGVRLYRGARNDDGTIGLSICGNGWSLLEALTILDGPPTPTAGGTPSFLVGMFRLDGLVGAVLNADGEVIHYAEGDVLLHEFAPCPDHDLVAVVSSEPGDRYGEVATGAQWWIELRKANDLSLVQRTPIKTGPIGDGGNRGIDNLECRNADGSTITATARNWRGSPGDATAYEGTAIVITADAIQRFDVAWLRDAALDTHTGALHVLHGKDGRQVTTVIGDTTTERTLPGSHVGWRLSVHDSVFEIVSEDIQVDPSNLNYGIVSHVLRGPFDALEVSELPLQSVYGSGGTILDTPDGRVFHFDDQDDAIFVPVDDLTQRQPSALRVHQTPAIGETQTLARHVDVESGVGRVDLQTGVAEEIDGLLGSRLVIAINPSDPLVYETPPPSTTTTTIAEPEPELSALDGTGPAAADGDTNNLGTVLGGLVVAAIVGLGAALAWRRRVTT